MNAEANLSTKANSALAYPRFSRPHGHPWRPLGDQAAAAPWPDPAHPAIAAGTWSVVKREQRLRRTSEFDVVYREGKVASGPLLAVRVRPNGQVLSRFGFVAGKRVGGAVVRNLARRRLRELIRQLPIQPGIDLVVFARPGAATASFAELDRALTQALKRLRVYGGPSADRPMAGRVAH